MTKTIIGVFSDSDSAEDAIRELESKDYNPKDMSIVMRNKDEAKKVAENTGADVAGNAAGGITSGAVLGGLAGLLAATVVPGLGALFIGGPIVAALGLGGAVATTASGAVTGAAAGGVLGALTGVLGLSEEDAVVYESRIKEGGILVAVPARPSEEDEVAAIMEANGADNIRTM